MLTACYVALDECEAITRSLRSILAYVQRVIVVDVAFLHWPVDGQVHSHDGQRQAVQAVVGDRAELLYLQPSTRLAEHHARNLYLSQLDLGAWALLIDADEVLYGDHDQVQQLIADLPGVTAGALGVPVLTTAVLTGRNAPEIDRDTYSRAPIIGSAGRMPKLVRRTPGLRHDVAEVAPGVYTHHGLWDGATAVDGSGLHTDAMLIVNDHVGQPWAGYQRDYTWEVAQRGGLDGA